ncbi:tetratricopeptide repeat protein [Sulfitobacter sp. 1A15106]|uniref:tetratricopeptide repeat protein n=1 Tax=Sulfitobacter sp. 1A15106 TaxID=3368590 RepID=UPI003744E889
MNKIEKPGKGTGVREGTRQSAEAGLSLLPGGGVLTSFARWLLPSKLDKQKAEWLDRITEATNQQGEDIEGLSAQTDVLKLEQADLVVRVDDTREHVDELARKLEAGIVEADPLDGELEICRELVLAEKYQTALDLLEERFDDPKRSNQISPKLRARIQGLQGMCLKYLGQFDAAAQHFLAALATDPESPKVRANAVVGYLIKGDTDAAVELLDRLIKDEPDMPMHWANLIYTRSKMGEVVDLKSIPVAIRQSKDVCIALIDAKRENSDPTWAQQAQEVAHLHPESERARRHGAEAALDMAVQAMVNDDVSVTEKTRRLQKAGDAALELERQWAEHLSSEASKAFPDVTLLQNALVAHRVNGTRAAASALVQAHVDLLLSDDRARQALGAFALDTGDEALLDRVLSDNFSGSGIIRLEKALRGADWAEALALCEKYPEEIELSGRIDPAFAADALRAILSEEPDQAAAFEEIFTRELPPDPVNELFLCQIASKAGLPDVADAAFARATAAEVGTDAELRRALAGEAMERDMPELVIDLLAHFVDPARDDRLRRWLAIAYARTSVPHEAGIAFFAAIRSVPNLDAELNRAGGHFHLNRRRPAEAVPWFRRSLEHEPHNVRTQLAYWQALNRDGAHRRAKDFLAGIDLLLIEGPAEDRMAMAQLLWRNGREVALEYAYELAARNRNDFQVCLGYSGLLLADAFDGKAPQIPDIDEVSIDAMVRLGRVARDDWVIVIDNNQSDLPDHVQVNNAIVQQALGKSAGETFETTTGPNCFSWTVREIKSKYLHLFHEITRTLQDQFPDNGSFYSMTIVDDDVTPILESVQARRKSVERLEENYREHPMPLGAVAKAGGGSTIDFAVHLAQSGRQVFSATGHASDTEREFAIAQKSFDRVLVLDAYTAWLLDGLGVLEAVKDAFPNLTLPASALDEFGEMIEEIGRNPDGRKSMTAHDDGYVIHESTAEEVGEHVSSLEQTRNRISRTCRVVGIEVSADADASFLRYSDFLGSQFDCLSVIQRENGVLVSADLRLRQIASEICNEQAFGLDALLRAMAIGGALSIESYADALLKLCSQGHSYVSLNGQIMQRMLMVDDTATLERFKNAAAYLGTPNADIETHILAAADFIGRAFRYYRGGLKAQRAASIVLRRILLLEAVEFSYILIKLINIIENPQVTDYVSKWLEGHFLLDAFERQVEARKA